MKTKYIILFSVLFVYCFKLEAQSEIYIYTPNGEKVKAIVKKEEYTSSEIAYINDKYKLDYPQADLIGNATTTYNCHGHAWYINDGGTPIGWVNQNPDLDKYWKDGSYIPAEENEAEIIFYYNGDHSAIKSKTHPGKYESKWGAMPFMRHSPEYGPSIYRMHERRYYKKALVKITGMADEIWAGNSCRYELQNLPAKYNSNVVWSYSTTLNYVNFNPQTQILSLESHEGAMRMEGKVTIQAYIPSINATIKKDVQVLKKYIDGYVKFPDSRGEKSFTTLLSGNVINTELKIDLGPNTVADVYITHPTWATGMYTWVQTSVNKGIFYYSGNTLATFQVQSKGSVTTKVTYSHPRLGRIERVISARDRTSLFSTSITERLITISVDNQQDVLNETKPEIGFSKNAEYNYEIVPLTGLSRIHEGKLNFINQTTNQIDISHMMSGYYVINVYYNNDKIYTQKFHKR